MASWNVRTLQDNDNNPERRTAVISKVLDKYSIDIAALSETRIPGNGQLKEKGYTYFWIGRPESETRSAGVGFAIKNSIAANLNQKPVGVNERLMTLRIPLTKEKYATFISAYAPTLTNSDEAKEKFYEELRSILLKIPPNDNIFLLGDFNARVGNESTAWPKVLGKHLCGKMNTNGLLLLSLCSEFRLSITNSHFQLPNRLKGTWRHPRSKHWHTLDYVITRQTYQCHVNITRAHRGTECWSDHRLVRSKFNMVSPKKPRRKKPTIRKKLDIVKLENPQLKENFAEEIEKAMDSCIISDDIETSWKALRDTIYDTSANLLGFVKRKHQDWFDENDQETSLLIKTMHQSHLQYMNNKRSKKLKKQYYSTKTSVQKRLRHLKDAWWKTKAEELQKAADSNNTKKFYDLLKKVYGPLTSTSGPLLSADGKKLLTDETEILQRWAEHFSEVLNRDSAADPDVINQIKQSPVIPELDRFINVSEVKDASKKFAKGKQSGQDGTPAEVFEAGGMPLLKKLTELLNKIWKSGQVPQNFKDASIVSLFKKGKRSLCDNYRGISLLSVAGKILARVILRRLNDHVTDVVYSESQCGFRKGRGTTDMIFCLRQLQEKAREHKSPLYMAFIDLTKAFDTVPRSALWTVLEKLGVPPKMRNVIISLHEGMEAQVIHSGKVSDAFKVENGTKQGCVLAPILFALYFAVMLKTALQNNNFGVPVCFRTTGGLFNIRRFTAKTKTSLVKICELLFADDCALVSHSIVELQAIVDSFSKACKSFGLTISVKKTEIVYQSPPNTPEDCPCSITVDGKPLKVPKNFCYLGSTINNKATLDDEIKARISKASSAFGRLQQRLWKTHDVSLLTKIMVYKSVVISSLLYSSETWTLYRPHINMLDAFHMRMLRSLCNVTWKDKITNHEILTKCKIPGIEAFLIKAQLRWAGHVVRMKEDRLPKIAMYGQLASAVRPMGRPLLRYKDKLKANISILGLKNWETVAQDRPKWRATCHKAVAEFETQRLDKMVISRMNRKHPEASTISSDFVCDVCSKRCKSNAGLTAHKRSHVNTSRTVEPLQARTCRICSKVCKSSRGLKLHLRVHR